MSSKIDGVELDDAIIYPDSDGEPLSENNEQLRFIFLIKSELDSIFAPNQNVAVEGDLLWYPIQGDNQTRRAPDTMVIFGRPKQKRGSYLQWKEDNIPPQVVFEIISPGNTANEMREKREFYERYKVEEYYEYDPDLKELRGWLSENYKFKPIAQMNGWVSPRLKIRFEQDNNGELLLYRPDGEPFRDRIELDELMANERSRALAAQQRAEQEEARAIEAMRRAEQERQRTLVAQQQIEQERQRTLVAQQQIEQERQRTLVAQQQAEQEKLRAEKLLAKLRELKIDVDDL